MAIVVLAGFVAALLLLWKGKRLRGGALLALVALPAGVFAYFLSAVPEVASGKTVLYSYPWIPSLDVNLAFRLDGLSMFFSLMISGIGTMIFVYASAYLKDHRHLNRFFAYLLMFMASMLGLVLAENIIVLFIFWELTSISSFFLIAFENENQEARRRALHALAVTGGGGFCLLAGLILLAGIYDTYAIEAMLRAGDLAGSHPLYPWVVVLLLAGVFTKSAQFPFHFWLPGAMAAPAPVSAYLHSATMVKAGVFLLMRFTPIFGTETSWNHVLLATGAVSMIFGAVHAVLRTDTKEILAYSTVSALGVMVFLIGIGTEQAYIACVAFIAAHALYKAALFLVAGAIDHETGMRDVTGLAGLGKVFLPLAVAGLLAAFCGGGIPATIGFIAKDLIYQATLDTGFLLATVPAVVTNAMLLYAAFVVGIKPFWGKLPDVYRNIQGPSWALWLPALLLALAGVLFGALHAVGDVIIDPAVLAMQGRAPATALFEWHGFNTVVLLSAITLAAGLLLYIFLKPSHVRLRPLSRLDAVAPERLLSDFSAGFTDVAKRYTRLLQNGFLRSYLITIIAFLIAIVAFILLTEVDIRITAGELSGMTIYELLIFLIMIGAIYKTLHTQSRLTAVVFMSVVGYCICMLFVLFSAPDLAMTQFAIDTLTIVLFVLVLLRLPPFLRYSNTPLKIRDGLLSFSFGLLIAAIALQVLNEPTHKMVSRFYADNAYLEARGKNVVNVILVDFRGLDTMVEITVLAIAAIGVYSLLKLKVNAKEKE